MLIELIAFMLVASFVAIAALGHVLLAVAIVRCVREDASGGRSRTVTDAGVMTAHDRFKRLPA
jgi:hypothetical protein